MLFCALIRSSHVRSRSLVPCTDVDLAAGGSRVAFSFPTLSYGWLQVAQVVAALEAVCLPVGFYTRFLRWQPVLNIRFVFKGAVAAVSQTVTEEI